MNIEMHVSGIKCDNLACDYQDPSAKLDDYEVWLNRPCPKCGHNLLTEKDLKSVLAIKANIEWLNALKLPVRDDAKRVKVKVKHDGSGIPTFESYEDSQ